MDHSEVHQREDFYHPLAGLYAFRVMILEPGQIFDPVSIRLQVVERATTPAYDAISYVWGDSSQKVRINCNGWPFEITASLYWALVRIRSPSFARILWADAICINQSDLKERSNQVTFMGSLYENAAKVYICMGDAEDRIALQVQTVISDANSVKIRDEFPTLAKDHPLKTDQRWYALVELTENIWFTRAWVVQEVALAKDPIVLWGRAEFKYRDLIQILKWLNASPWAIKFGLTSLFIHLEWAEWRLGAHHPGYTFVDLLSHASLLNCSDARDKVYAFLGHPLALATSGDMLVKPDYQKSAEQVFLELSKTLILNFGLRVLTTVEHTEDTIIEELPSWVTRWDLEIVMNDIYRVPNMRFNASAGLAVNSVFIAEENQNLVVQGIVLDRVRQSFAILGNEMSWIRFKHTLTGELLTLRRVLEELSREDGNPSIYADKVGAFCSTICIGGRIIEQDAKRVAFNLLRMWENGNERSQNTFLREEQDETLAYYHQLKVICINRTLIITEKGFFGLAPQLTRMGDTACILAGVDVPLILRPTAEGKFRLLGESYIHGIMEGQVKEMVERKEVYEQKLVIC